MPYVHHIIFGICAKFGASIKTQFYQIFRFVLVYNLDVACFQGNNTRKVMNMQTLAMFGNV